MIDEALQDGVTYCGRNIYLIPCEICGELIKRTQYSRKRTYICDSCKKIIKEKKEGKKPDTDSRHDKRFNCAVEKVKKQVKNFDKYDKAVRVARTRAYQYASIPEAMLAIELLKNKLKIIPQQKIGKYKADFVIPSMKFVVEVDGELYHSDLGKEAERDFYINRTLGFDWKVVHIPARYVLEDVTKVTKYILKCKEI